MMSCCLTTYVYKSHHLYKLTFLITNIIFLFWAGEEAGKGEEVGSYCR